MEPEDWYAGLGDDRSDGLDGDYSFVVRRWLRAPEKRPWGDVDYGESEPVAVCTSEEDRDRILLDHKKAELADQAGDMLSRYFQLKAEAMNRGALSREAAMEAILRWDKDAGDLLIHMAKSLKDDQVKG